VSTIAEFDEEHYAASSEQVASGGLPVQRMRSATLTVTPESMIVLGSGASGAVRIIARHMAPASGAHNKVPPKGQDLSATQIAFLFTDTGLIDVVMADGATVKAVTAILSGSPDPMEKRLAKIVRYLAKQPAINHCAVLTNALREKFWSPDGPSRFDDLRMWGSAFHFDHGSSRFGAIDDLIDICRVGKSPLVDRKSLRNSSSTITKELLRGRRSRVSAFDALQSHGDMWNAVCGSDGILYKRGTVIGSTVAVSPVDRHGAKLIATVSMPFKLRVGSEIAVFTPGADETYARAQLEGMDFDAATNSLMVRLAPVQRRSKDTREQSARWENLCGSRNFGRSDLFAVAAPFMGGGWGNRGSKSSGQTAGNGSISREVPLDVALAAQDV
jgi:hypothetical protein